ncbi:MAG: hypothetical protein WCS28_06440 [Thiomicrospira sp.]
MNISKVASLTTPSNALQRQVSTTHTFELKPSHKNEATPDHKANNLAQALQDFYHIHQRSQITGVPTSEYNQAVQALGLNPDEDPFAGIRALEKAGFKTGSPTIGAILEYGAQPQMHGNQSYLAASLKEKSDQRLPDFSVISQEISQLNEKHNNMLGSASNYFEAAQALAQQTDIQNYADMTLGQALPIIQAALSQVHHYDSTQHWIERRFL